MSCSRTPSSTPWWDPNPGSRVKYPITEPLRSSGRYGGSYMSAPLDADIEALTGVLLLLQVWTILHECSSCCRYGGSNMSVLCFRYRGFCRSDHLVADMEDLTWVFLAADTENLTWVILSLQIWRILHKCSLLQIQMILSECSYCCKYGGSYMSSPLVADMEDRTWVLLVADMEDFIWVLHLLLCLFVFVCLILYVPVNNLSVTSGQVYLG